MTKLLIIGYVWPEPASSAAGGRMLELIDLFKGQGWDITFASPAADSDHAVDLEALGVKKVSVEINNASFDAFVAALQPDIVLFDRFMIEEQFGWRVEEMCPDSLRVLDTVDLHCLRNARHVALKENRDVTRQDLFSELAMREVASTLRSDLSLIISSFELELLKNEFGVDDALMHEAPFMPDLEVISTGPGFDQRRDFISIGNFRHEPNWDAVLYLKRTIWPMIHRELPDAQLHVYGAYPPPKATQLHSPKDGFHVMGWADDVRMVMQQARVCLAPLRFGAGLKGKLIDAMQSGTPTVTTSIGAEGMHGEMEWGGAIEDDPEAFAAAAVAIYSNIGNWMQHQRQGLEILQARFDREKIGQRLLIRIDQVCGDLTRHRMNNFTGAMLRHHTMKSTRYMAKWIEAKRQLAEASETNLSV